MGQHNLLYQLRVWEYMEKYFNSSLNLQTYIKNVAYFFF